MKFEKTLSAKASQGLFIDESFVDSVVRYKILKKFIKNTCEHYGNRCCSPDIETSESAQCCICLDSIEAHHGVTTSCSHHFHPACLITSLSTGTCDSCPLCRRPAKQLVPSGLDGETLRFLAMVLVNMNAVDACHTKFMGDLESRLHQYESGSYLDSEMIQRDIETLEKVIEFDHLNSEGFRKILKKFDKRTGMGVSEGMLARLRNCRFAKDADARCQAAGSRLQHCLHRLGSHHHPPPRRVSGWTFFPSCFPRC
uniref:RING-type domain-containing protein n=1 Tax=Cryptomonas paramaecium TaxID=2898 RepID=A0A7S4PRK4_9CRYP|mmetsp:Transcript_10040/g.28783  ORF Transcript_10040/g.28783 Transcript_10040/m.28783 type:complete len:255 (+) Transcript_10040:137-901(+)